MSVHHSTSILPKLRLFLFAALLFTWFGETSDLGGSFNLRPIIAFFLGISFSFSSYVNGLKKLFKMRQTQVALILLFLISISWLTAGSDDVPALRNNLTLMMIMIWTVMIIKDAVDLRRFMYIYPTIICLLAIIGIFLHLTGNASYFISESDARMSVWGNANDTAIMFCTAVPFCLTLITEAKIISLKILSVLALITILIGVAATGSRGGILLFASIFLASIVFQRNVKNKIILSSLMAMIALLFFNAILRIPLIDAFIERLSSIVNIYVYNIHNPMDSHSTRQMAQAAGINTWLDNPIWGIGFGSFSSSEIGWTAFIGSHNMFIQLLAEMGIVGFACFCVLLIVGYKGFWPNWKYQYGLIFILLTGASFQSHIIVQSHALYLFITLSGIASTVNIDVAACPEESLLETDSVR